MSDERAHPDSDGFRRRLRLRRLWRFMPVLRWESTPYRDALLWRYAIVQDYVRRRAVVDVPCGMGWGSSLLRGYDSLVGVDISESAVAEANSRYANRKRSFQVGNMGALQFGDNSVDVVSCLEGIEHVDTATAAAFVGECARILRTEGTLVISSPYRKDGKHSGNPWHLHEYQPDELRSLLSGSFGAIRTESRCTYEVVIDVHVLRPLTGGSRT